MTAVRATSHLSTEAEVGSVGSNLAQFGKTSC